MHLKRELKAKKTRSSYQFCNDCIYKRSNCNKNVEDCIKEAKVYKEFYLKFRLREEYELNLDLDNKTKNLLKKKYLNKDEEGNITETPTEMFKRVSENIASAEKSLEKQNYYKKKFYEMMTRFEFLPNSPTLMNAGTELQQLAACFVLGIDDSMNDIFNTVKEAALIHKSGGGTGFTFSDLRPNGDIVKSTGGVSSGPISFMEVFNSATNTVKQGGKRRGANMGMLRVDHPDILDFIKAKGELNETNQQLYEEFKKVTNDQIKLKKYKKKLLDNQFANFNLSIAITDEFMEALNNEEDYDLVNPRTGNKVDSLSSKKVWDLITDYAWQNGEPGLVFIDEINDKHPLTKEIKATNPCGEQPLLPNEACNLGSINLAKMVEQHEAGDPCAIDWNRLKQVTKLAVRFLDNVITVNNYPLDIIEETSKRYRKVGLGVMGFHELLIKLNIPYNSKEAVEVANEVMKFINDKAHQASIDLAKEKGTFPGIDDLENKNLVPRRNATLTTIAPTGSISQLAGTSGGIEPFFSFSYTHTDGDGDKSKFEYDFTDYADEDTLVTTMDIEPEWHIRIQAAFQQHVDNAVSKTINMPNSATKEDVKGAYRLAYKLGCKGLTIYRDGSKSTQVLNDGNSSEVESGAKITPKGRPKITDGETIRSNTGCGKLYLTINRDKNGKLIETFLTTGSDGGCQVMTEAVSRLTSMALRAGIDPKEVVDQLSSTSTCPSFMYQKGKGEDLTGKSCPDVVGKVLDNITTKTKSDNYQLKTDSPKCPECNNELVFEEGCSTCKKCGFSYCD